MANGIPTFIKWAGGKTQLLEQYKSMLAQKIDRYFEPFLGSGAIFFFVKKQFNPKYVLLSDTNEELINCFKVVRDNVGSLIEKLKQHKKNNNKEYFYKIRKLDSKDLSSVESAARFIYLNKTCYNGLYRVNSRGQFNVPFGRYKNPQIFDEDTLKEASRLLKGIIIEVQDFEKAIDSAKKGDFIYFDPPYYSQTAGFTGYTKTGFAEEEQKRLAEVFKKLDKKGCKLMLSNSDHPFIRDLYKEYDMTTVKARRMINCIGTKRGIIKETVVKNYNSIKKWFTK